MTPETEKHFEQLVAEANALFGSHHYREYHFLLTLSDDTAHFGLEHHESSDDRARERSLTDETTRIQFSGLLPHEYVHSWNGKYRRPAGLLSPDYHQPMKDDLLWVYEGLTEYLGSELLTVRSGLWSEEQGREELARLAAGLANEPGRTWRPLQDTADSAPFLYGADDDWSNWRRGTDFYEEGIYLWLDVDTTIRRLTNDQKSLDDFCHLFYGATTGQPDLKPYAFDDVVTALNEIAPYDWKGFLRARLDQTCTSTPIESLEASGWKLVYNEQPNPMQENHDAVHKDANLNLSIGLKLAEDGWVEDVFYNGPSFLAGIGPGMKIKAVNGREFSTAAIRDAIRAAKNDTHPIELIVANGVDVETVSVDYHGGLRYPHLVRDETHPDYLGEIIHPRVK
jgi:predicted metalloprotease with PDZ domain